MPMCEKCWRDSADPYGDHADKYQRLVAERDAAGTPCTPEEHAGEWWSPLYQVDTRSTYVVVLPDGSYLRDQGNPEQPMLYRSKAYADNAAACFRKVDGAPYDVRCLADEHGKMDT